MHDTTEIIIACITHHPYTQGNSDFDGDVARWPDVAYVDVVNNIILDQSPSRSRLRLRRWSCKSKSHWKPTRYSIDDPLLFVAKVLNAIYHNVTE